ncbi:pentapeptide repeat-containing protein [Candidatus Chloroploca sp. M-50]|uniref:Pentapeptide repeat-containing protein n=1 Tax=Candidatus Chloroploca mongolica TaxID=2528176 RepID=A0ABS4DHJ9_9CHLR|nr:pentapeptide repeat-containing protein [Candidatus Chloroploca mongolica]MBP1468905.1 pentapeptide repeat-containing protein [Candidatus Chloroploca mongolica]
MQRFTNLLISFFKSKINKTNPDYASYGVAVFLVVSALGCLIFGILVDNDFWKVSQWFSKVVSSFYPNIVTDALGIAFTIFILDQLNAKRADRQLKEQLIRQLASPDQGLAIQALEELRSKKWAISDGSLQKARLQRANLQGANLILAELSDADFTLANLQEAIFVGAKMQRAKLCGAILQDASFQGAELCGADMKGAKLQKANFYKAELQSANLFMAEMQGVDLREANLEDADLGKADLRGANLQQAKMKDVDLFQVDMSTANLTGCHIDDKELSRAKSLRRAIMPDGQLYDGHLRLWGDVLGEKILEEVNGNPLPSSEIAEWYEISLDTYRNGQQIYNKNLLISLLNTPLEQ